MLASEGFIYRDTKLQKYIYNTGCIRGCLLTSNNPNHLLNK